MDFQICTTVSIFNVFSLAKIAFWVKQYQPKFFYVNTCFDPPYFNIQTLPKQIKNTSTGWLAFPITIKDNAPFTRTEFQIFLEKRNIQTRVIFSGDITKQPFMKNEKYTLKKGINKNANFIMQNGILIGCHQLLKLKELKYICHSITQFINKNLK